MSIGKFLLSKENLELVKKKSWKLGRPEIIDQGMHYYSEHANERDEVQRNLEYMGLPSSKDDVEETLRHIVIHYYEKLFGLVKRYEVVWIAKNRVELGDSLQPFLDARVTEKAVFVANCHFAGTYFLPAVLVSHGIEPHMIGRYPEPVRSLFTQTASALVERYGAAPAHLFNVDDPNLDIPLKMMSLLMGKKVVSNVFDEPNQFSKIVTLLGRNILGGSGMDLILRQFTDDQVIVVTPFLIRTSDETFRLEVDRHSLSSINLLVSSLYRSLEKRLREHFHQWYFIHELREAIPGAEHPH